ncbi:Heparan sulfate-N-deacetylase [Trinorchestia longiramus]|nr:Heparan sulfate-N-deacetylase [Trinorchestia longiramus]
MSDHQNSRGSSWRGTNKGAGYNCWRRCKWKIVQLPRSFLSSRKFVAVVGALVLLIIYLISSSSVSISKYLSHVLPTTLMKNFKSVENNEDIFNTRLTWQGGSAGVDSPPLEDAWQINERNWRLQTSALRLPWQNPHGLTSHGHNTQIPAKILIFSSKKKGSAILRAISELLDMTKFRYDLITLSPGSSLPDLVLDVKYQCFIFDDFKLYLNRSSDERKALDSFMEKNNVGMIAFILNNNASRSSKQEQLRGYPILLHNRLTAKELRLMSNTTAGLYRILRSGVSVDLRGSRSKATVSAMLPQHPHLTPVMEAQVQSTPDLDSYVPTALLDGGAVDGIRRVVMAVDLSVWLQRLLFLDALSYIGGGDLSLPLDRHLLVDVDDIFVARSGIRMTDHDVKAMLESQERLREWVPGFTFNLGFSGYYFLSGNAAENLGDKALVGNASYFWWFGHMWKHTQPHKLDGLDEVKAPMLLNRHFAKTFNISVDTGYSVAPHHSGVYPVHEPLYDAWKKVYNIRATSTEEYPHLKPDRLRRGFQYRGIQVLPRQMCGLFTHTIYFESPEHPGLKAKLDASIDGGELFQTIAFNPISVFMTHMSNYASDRLALYVFEGVVQALQKRTNFALKTEPPALLADRYFALYPEEAQPLWGNPCLDKRHLEIWSRNKTCDQLPDLLVLGPQKTGTTALHTFLGLHPSLRHNLPSPTTFEEVQFFSSHNYDRGLDWYLKWFPPREPGQVIFEKSATYFDSPVAPARVRALLPNARLVVLLLPPERRAYSWYQHQVAHGVPAAVNHSFSEVLRAEAPPNHPKDLYNLRARCLEPGEYARHLERWLEHFPAEQLLLVDGEQLRQAPVQVMGELQTFLAVQPTVDYAQLIRRCLSAASLVPAVSFECPVTPVPCFTLTRYSPRKGFYCQVTRGSATKCLGKSKGKHYPAMLPHDERLLKAYYSSHNDHLLRLMQQLQRQPPLWLSNDTQPIST